MVQLWRNAPLLSNVLHNRRFLEDRHGTTDLAPKSPAMERHIGASVDRVQAPGQPVTN
jgi:hypothetical protein